MLQLISFLSGTSELDGNADLGELQGAMDVVQSVASVILTIIYIVLGLFLVIKGAILGMQIVKAADEPQVRQEKIGSLKWLVIGIAIAYGVSFVTDILIRYFTSVTPEVSSGTGSA